MFMALSIVMQASEAAENIPFCRLWQTMPMRDFRFPDAWPFNFGAYLRKTRERLGLRVTDVAERSGGNLATSTISVLERNLVRGNPSLRQLDGFSRVFEVDAIYLFALAYAAEKQLDPAAIDKVWNEFAVERLGAWNEEKAVVSVPRQHLELLGLSDKNLRFYSLRRAGLLSFEAARGGYVTECDIVGVDANENSSAGDYVLGWWQDQEKLLVYRQNIDVANVLVPAQSEGEPSLVLANVTALKRLGVVVWRCGPVPKR